MKKETLIKYMINALSFGGLASMFYALWIREFGLLDSLFWSSFYSLSLYTLMKCITEGV